MIEGTVDFEIGGERRLLKPGDTYVIPGNVPHEAVAGSEGRVLIDVLLRSRRLVGARTAAAPAAKMAGRPLAIVHLPPLSRLPLGLSPALGLLTCVESVSDEHHPVVQNLRLEAPLAAHE